jgi:hypothetical protein
MKSGPKPVLLSNPSPASVAISSITVLGPNAGDFAETDTCDGKLLPGTNCKISVTVTPTAIGSRIATLTISDNTLAHKQTVALTALGTP